MRELPLTVFYSPAFRVLLRRSDSPDLVMEAWDSVAAGETETNSYA